MTAPTQWHTEQAEQANLGAYHLGIGFALGLNATPTEAQNWSALGPNDDMPSEDYRYLAQTFGDVTAAMERAYRRGFNATFVFIGKED